MLSSLLLTMMLAGTAPAPAAPPGWTQLIPGLAAGTALARDASGDLYLAGSAPASADGSRAATLVRTRADARTVRWQYTWPTPKPAQVTALALTGDEIIVAVSTLPPPRSAARREGSKFVQQTFIAALGADGKPRWRRPFISGGQLDGVRAMATLSNGDVGLAGTYLGPAQLDGRPVPPSKWGGSFVARISANGKTRWLHTAHTEASFSLIAVAAMPGDGLVVSGVGRGSVHVDAESGARLQIGEDGAEVMRFDGRGGLVWAKAFGDPRDPHAFASLLSVASDAAGNVYASGYFRSRIAFGDDLRTSADNDDDILLLSLDPSGALRWARTGGATSLDQGRLVRVAPDGSLRWFGLTTAGFALDPARPQEKLGPSCGFVAQVRARDGGVVRAVEFGPMTSYGARSVMYPGFGVSDMALLPDGVALVIGEAPEGNGTVHLPGGVEQPGGRAPDVFVSRADGP